MTAGAKTRRIQSLPTDKYIAVYCLVVFALSFRSTTLTDAFRILFNLSVDVALPYLAVTRSVAGKEGFVRVFAAIAASGAVMSMIGIFEAGKKWLLFRWSHGVVRTRWYRCTVMIFERVSCGRPRRFRRRSFSVFTR